MHRTIESFHPRPRVEVIALWVVAATLTAMTGVLAISLAPYVAALLLVMR